MQLIHISRRQLVLAVDKMLLKLLGCAQKARLEERHQIEQLFQIVLNRRGGQEQDELFFQLAWRKPPKLGVTVAEVMGLVDDNHVPLAGQNRRPVRFAFGGVHRGNDAVEACPGGGALFLEGGVVMADEIETELAAFRLAIARSGTAAPG